MKSTSVLFTLLALAFTSLQIQAQLPVSNNLDPIEPNFRLALNVDADGGVDGDELNGFEIAHASKIYPLDQMVISYAHANRSNNASHDVMIAIEDHFPLSETIVPYGIAGLGYRWIDHAAGEPGDSTGWVGKIGLGVIVKTSDTLSVYAELAYHASDRDLWADSEDADSQNVVALVGVRFFY
jgi:hypothetical protein